MTEFLLPASTRAETRCVQKRLNLPTLGILPVLAVSVLGTGEAVAQALDEGENLGTILLEAGSAKGEAAEGYAVTESANDKLLTPLIDTPKTVKVITRKEMAERGQTSVEDILRSTPGITLGTGEGGNPPGLNPTIRGNTASNDVLIDGFRSPLRTSYEAFNMESVEITKGPGGTLAGTGSTGGTINLNSKAPRDGDFADASLSFGTGRYARATLDVNRDFGALGLRLNLMAQDAESLGGREGRSSGRVGIAPSISYEISDATKVTAGLYYSTDEDLIDYGVPLSNANTAGSPLNRGAGTVEDPWQPMDVSTGAFYGNKNRDFHDATTKSAYVRLDHEFADGLKWSSRVALNDSENAYFVSRPAAISATEVSGTGAGRDLSGQGLSFNSQLSGEAVLGGVETRYAFGVDYSRTVNKRHIITATPGTSPTLIDSPDPSRPWVGTLETSPQNLETKTYTRGVYGFATVDLAPQWEASVGLRYDSFDTNSWSDSTAGVRTFAENSSNFWNGNIGLVYKPSENGSIYASLSTSANPGGEPNGAGGGADSSLNKLDPERAVSLELGTKWTLFEDRLYLSAAVFRIEKDNARQPDENGDLANIGKNRSQGFEFDVAGNINEQWSLSAGYSYIDSKIIDAGFSNGLPSPNNGTRTTGVPMHSFSLWTTYALNDQLTLGGGATFIGKRPLNATRTVELPDQIRVDLMASYALNEATSVQFNANNIFDEQLYTGNRGNGWTNVEAGRNFTLTLNHAF